jgi:hypothetical protein
LFESVRLPRRWLRLALALVSVAVGLFFGWIRLHERTAEQHVDLDDDSTERIAAVRSRLPTFFADRARLMADPLFAPRKGRPTSELDGYVRWIPPDFPSAVWDRAQERSAWQLPRVTAFLPERMLAEVLDWTSLSGHDARQAPSGIDGWIDRLSDEDTWDIETEPRARTSKATIPGRCCGRRRGPASRSCVAGPG